MTYYDVMLHKRAGVFYRGINFASWPYTPIKTRPASLLNDFKNIPRKSCLNGVDNNHAFVNVAN